MIIVKIILWIIIVSAAAGLFALINDLRKPETTHKPFGPYEKYFKRFLDAFFSTAALICLSPALLLIAILVRIRLGSPVLFSQERPGRDEKIFRIYKFRTMTDQRDANGELLPDSDRLTAFGAVLRSTSLDELPELINIIKGDMSIVGPRPLLVEYLPYYTHEEKHRHDVRPGLTGLAQVNGRNLLNWDDRLAFDIRYVSEITFLGDMRIICRTIKQVLKRENVAVDPVSENEKYLYEIREKTE